MRSRQQLRATTLALRSEALDVRVCPAEGGRVSSLRCAVSGTEFLTEARERRAAVEPGFKAQFAEGACAGIEDCLPTVGACGEGTEGGPAPDHGDLWQIPWTVLEHTESAVQLEVRTFSRPLVVQKTLRVEGRSLRLSFLVTNVGTEQTSLLYAAHPLLAVERGDRVVLPAEVRSLAVTYARGWTQEAVGGRTAWPLASDAGRAVDLSVTGGARDGRALMLYSDRLQQGACGLFRTHAQQGVVVRFAPEQLPFLGVWLCYGGWPDEDGAPAAAKRPAQYAVALEPTFAPCGRLDEAQRAGMARALMPGGSASWEIVFDVTPPGNSLDAFVQTIG